VVWGGAVPKREAIAVNLNKAHCLSKGPLYRDNLVVNPKNKGVRWAMVWLVHADAPRKALPIHPALKKVAPAKVEMDQPCCQFEPHMVGLRLGQALVIKNSAPIAYNVSLVSAGPGPLMNAIVPPSKQLTIAAEQFRARPVPIRVRCNIHAWMGAWVFAFDHPYFAVTDENGNFAIKNVPVGKVRVVAWHEEVGWADGRSPLKGGGKLIAVKGKGSVVSIELTPPRP
jgi:hypothetical protein